AGQIRSQRICHSLAALQGSMSLALKGQRVALFKTQRVLSCNSNYFGYKHTFFEKSPSWFKSRQPI
nr:hypothetical protein [Dickeya chrysanthemi]